ncbi:MAG: hypothetical protein R6W82_00345 [bacterium]
MKTGEGVEGHSLPDPWGHMLRLGAEASWPGRGGLPGPSWIVRDVVRSAG